MLSVNKVTAGVKRSKPTSTLAGLKPAIGRSNPFILTTELLPTMKKFLTIHDQCGWLIKPNTPQDSRFEHVHHRVVVTIAISLEGKEIYLSLLLPFRHHHLTGKI